MPPLCRTFAHLAGLICKVLDKLKNYNISVVRQNFSIESTNYRKGFYMTKSEAVGHFGSMYALAKALNMTPEGVRAWGETPTYAYQLAIEKLTKGRLKAVRQPAKISANRCKNAKK